MSAPLVVSTRDGAVWTRRTVTSSGIALYAPETVRTCPEFVMATLPELAEHGIKATAEVLPTPVEVKPLAPRGRPRTMLDRAREALGARMTKDALRLVLENVIAYAAELRAENDQWQATFGRDALPGALARVERAGARITELEAALAAERIPYRERAARETSPARRAAWRQLARAEESEARLERLLAAPADDDPEAGDAS